MKAIKMGLSEKISTQRKRDRRSHRETQELRAPLLRPKRGNEGQKSPAASLKFVEPLANKGEWRKGTSLKPFPFLKECVRPHCHGVVQRRKINREPVVEGSGEEAGHHWPLRLQLVNHILSKGPFGAQNLLATTQRIGNHILGPHDKLGHQSDLPRFRPTEEELSLMVERCEKRSPRFLMYDRAVVLSENTPTVRPCREWRKW